MLTTHTQKTNKKGRRPLAQSKDGNESLPFETDTSLSSKVLIDLFTKELKYILESAQLTEFIQQVKGALYQRNYLEAFDNDDKRFAYVSRWTPSRALAYSSLFSSLDDIVELLQEPTRVKNVLCIGGGACSELVGLGSVFCRLKEYNSTSSSCVNVDIIDIADWSKIVTTMTNYIKQNWIYQGENFHSKFIHSDILSNRSYNYTDIDLITLLFTTNELFAEKRTPTIHFLQKLNQECKSGTLLLMAESAGSYSYITIGTKKFPVQFMIDTILLGKQNDGPWSLVNQSDSCWYRLPEIDYPMKLENMRFFYRLYRKT